jgi:Domain of unknown function (DUF222)
MSADEEVRTRCPCRAAAASVIDEHLAATKAADQGSGARTKVSAGNALSVPLRAGLLGFRVTPDVDGNNIRDRSLLLTSTDALSTIEPMFEAVDVPSQWIDDYFDSLDTVTDLAARDADSILEEILHCEQIVAAVQARQLRALARFADLRPDRRGVVIDEFAADEIAPLLRITRNTAHIRLDLAVQLSTRLPGTLAALDRGEIDLYKARILTELTDPLQPAQAAAVEAQVLPRAAEQTPGQLRAAARRAVLRIDPHGAEHRRQERIRDRAVIIDPGEDGTAQLTAVNLDAADAVAAYQRLDAYARAMSPTDGRTMDQRRADALIDLILGRGSAQSTTTGAQIHVTVAASTLLGLDEHPGELAGYGAITAHAARTIAADATWRRILTDPASGTLLDVGRSTYRPPQALADHIRTRDRTCRFPGCRHPARRCDIDHGIPYPDGPTSACNLCCLCRHHHRLKHHGNWTVDHGPDATITWTSPTGRQYVTRPEPIPLPNTTADNQVTRQGESEATDGDPDSTQPGTPDDDPPF